MSFSHLNEYVKEVIKYTDRSKKRLGMNIDICIDVDVIYC